MTERLSNELASLLAEDDGRSDQGEGKGLLRARLTCDISEGLEQGTRAPGEGEEGAIDPARIAAYLDGSLSPAEREAIAIELAGDPVARSELTSALLLLRGLEAETTAIPAGLSARAVGILAATQPILPQASASWRTRIAVWLHRPAAWSALAALLLVAALTPAVLSFVQEWSAGREGPTVRGLGPVPTGIAACDDFLKKYEACITSKLPEAERTTHRAQLDQMRKAWVNMAKSPASKSTLEPICKQTMEATKAVLQGIGCTF